MEFKIPTPTKFNEFPIDESFTDAKVAMDNYYAKFQAEITFMKREMERLDKEITFFPNYFCRAWGLNPQGKDYKVHFNQVIDRKKFVASNGKGVWVKQNLGNEMPVEDNNAQMLDPIVYFNVEGEIIPIPRSTILRVIPESQLAIRVSGRWVEQPGDLDEEGNLKVHYHNESFENILSSLQIHQDGSPLEIFATALNRDAIEKTLDYLLIKPGFIKLVDTVY
jgi:hypothetical protein